MAGADKDMQMWIGLKLGNGTDTLHWADGQMTTWSNWLEGEPNEPIGKKDVCVRLRYMGNVWKWADMWCERVFGFICEKEDFSDGKTKYF